MDVIAVLVVLVIVGLCFVAFNFKMREREARRDAEALSAENSTLRSESAKVLRGAEAQAKQIKQVAEESADRILKSAEAKAMATMEQLKVSEARRVQVESVALELSRKVESLKALAVAERNRVEGWQDQYILPMHVLLDELADHVGWDEAGTKLKAARESSKSLVKRKVAIECNWGDDGYKRDAIRLMHEAFDSQVDLALEKVKGEVNVGKVIQEIRDIAESLNDYAQRCMRARIVDEYIASRITEAKWGAVAYELRQKERLEQKEALLKIREEEKVAREIEKARREAEREEEVARRAILKAQQDALDQEKVRQREYESKLKEMERQMKEAALKDEDARKQNEAEIRAQMQALLLERDKASEEQRLKFESERSELAERLRAAEEQNQRALSMAQQTKRGHVYIISNHGSFGEEVLKIGMTRRLDPMDRVWELGDASVPFDFDVHAMILSDDAPALENRLHRLMADRRVNKVNLRKEYFRLTITEVRAAVEDAGVKAEWTMAAKAQEYRESLSIEADFQRDPDARRRWLDSTSGKVDA